jgi:hypothetical protein
LWLRAHCGVGAVPWVRDSSTLGSCCLARGYNAFSDQKWLLEANDHR